MRDVTAVFSNLGCNPACLPAAGRVFHARPAFNFQLLRQRMPAHRISCDGGAAVADIKSQVSGGCFRSEGWGILRISLPP